MTEAKEERDIVIAVFKEKPKAQKALAKDGVAAANIEILAHEAVIVTKNADGSLTISRSEHSVKRSLATLTAKLMVVLPLGFYGVLATTAAGLEISAAARKRDDATEVNETDLAFLVDQMKPGWSAVLAAYPPQQVNNAVTAFWKLGAVMVWHAPESSVEEAVRQNQIED